MQIIAGQRSPGALGKASRIGGAIVNASFEPQFAVYHKGQGLPAIQFSAGISLQLPAKGACLAETNVIEQNQQDARHSWQWRWKRDDVRLRVGVCTADVPETGARAAEGYRAGVQPRGAGPCSPPGWFSSHSFSPTAKKNEPGVRRVCLRVDRECAFRVLTRVCPQPEHGRSLEHATVRSARALESSGVGWARVRRFPLSITGIDYREPGREQTCTSYGRYLLD